MTKELSRTYQLDIQQDASGCVFVALIVQNDIGQWGWVADCEFGPFDTLLDLTQWLTRKLRLEVPRFMS